MLRPVLIGLPGCGKSAVTRLLARELGLEIFDSDKMFRECRAVPPGDDPRRQIMVRFIAGLSGDPRQDALREASDAVGASGHCLLADGLLFRRFGEDLFRRYETEMLRWYKAQGAFDRALVDLSSSAPLVEANRLLFNTGDGFLPILLDAPIEPLARNLLADYALARSASKPVVIRGGIEAHIDAAVGPDGMNAPDGHARAEQEARRLTMTFASERLPVFRSYADRVIAVDMMMSALDIAFHIMEMLQPRPDRDNVDHA